MFWDWKERKKQYIKCAKIYLEVRENTKTRKSISHNLIIHNVIALEGESGNAGGGDL